MANKENTEKSNKQYYKTRISELEKLLAAKDRTIYDLRCNLKMLENKLKQPKRKSKPKPVCKKEAAIENAKRIAREMAAKNKPEGEEL